MWTSLVGIRENIVYQSPIRKELKSRITAVIQNTVFTDASQNVPEISYIIDVLRAIITATTTTTEAPKFSCEPPDGAEAEAMCPMDTLLLNALGSKSPFFGDALSPKCHDFKENLYDASKEEIHYFFSVDNGITINAYCNGEYDVITSK
ncbi:uncharacterized protein TNCV_688111 [Trichonephila clavipes]|nr:uncharacterized protein TNCV_688111 [Trichonephila clavipes]